MGSWQHREHLLPAPTNSNPDRHTLSTLHRTHQTVLFRLRTHHEPPNAHLLYRIKKEHQAKCVYCPDSDETVEHSYSAAPCMTTFIRTRLLPTQPQLLYNQLSHLNPLDPIHKTQYMCVGPLCHTSAMNRRDKIVRNVGDQER